MLEVGRKVLRGSLDIIAEGCYTAVLSTATFNVISITEEIMSDDIGLSRKEVLHKCGKGAVVPSVMFAMGMAFKGISRLV